MAIAVAATATGQNTTNTNAHTVDLTGLGTQGSDDLVVIIFGNDGGNSKSVDTGTYPGWTVFDLGGSANISFACIWRRATGSGDPSSIVVDLTGSQMAAWTLYRITGASSVSNPFDTPDGYNSGSSTSPDPPNEVTDWGSAQNLFIAGMVSDKDATVSGYPSNYTANQLTATNGNSPHGCTVGSACRLFMNRQDDPGTFTISASQFWAAGTAIIRPKGIVIAGQATGSQNTNSTTHTVDLSTIGTQQNNDIVMFTFFVDGNDTASINTGTYPGWTVTLVGGLGTSAKCYRCWRRATGSGDPTSVVVDTSGSQMSAWTTMRLTGCLTSGDPFDTTTSVASGLSTTPNPPSETVSWNTEESLWIASAGIDGNQTITGYPSASGYTGAQLTATNGSASDGVTIGTACKILATGTDDAGTFTASALASWFAATQNARPAGAPTFQPAWGAIANRLIIPGVIAR